MISSIFVAPLKPMPVTSRPRTSVVVNGATESSYQDSATAVWSANSGCASLAASSFSWMPFTSAVPSSSLPSALAMWTALSCQGALKSSFSALVRPTVGAILESLS